jgi:hypothetical protein
MYILVYIPTGYSFVIIGIRSFHLCSINKNSIMDNILMNWVSFLICDMI